MHRATFSRFSPITARGNLLAARQEIEKLALLLPEGELTLEAVLAIVADVARYDVFQLSAAWLAGDAERALRILAGARDGGRDRSRSPCGNWAKTFMRSPTFTRAMKSGVPVATAVRNARVWGKRQAALERAARRVAPQSIGPLVTHLARIDALAKGLGRGNAWEEISAAALTLSGHPARPLALLG